MTLFRGGFLVLLLASALLLISGGTNHDLRAERATESPVATLSDGIGLLALDPYLEILKDPDRNLTIGDVTRLTTDRARPETRWNEALDGRPRVFVRGARGKPNFGYSKSVFWLRFTLKNQSQSEDWVLQTAYAPLDQVELYTASTKGDFTLYAATGDHIPLSQTAASVIPYVHAAMKVRIPAGGSATYYMRIQTNGAYTIPVSISGARHFVSEAVQRTQVFWAYTGIMMAMLLYNLFLFLSLRDRSYLYYTIYTSAAVFFFLTADGSARILLWPESSYVADISSIYAIWFLIVAITKFSESFLYLRLHAPVLRRIAQAIMLVGFSFIIVAPFLDYAIAIQIASASGFACLIYSLVAGAYVYRIGFRPARYFLLAWSGFLAGTIALVLRGFGILPDNFLTANGALIGSAAEAILLSIGLADRINEMARARRQAELEASDLRNELRQKEKMAVIGDMAAGIVHDLKNPVSVIKMCVELANEDDLGAENRRTVLHSVDQEADRMLSMVQDLLEYAKGSINVEKKDQNIDDYLERVRRTIQPNFDARGLRCTVTSELSGHLRIDPDRFLRAIVNIASNAADALQAGGQFAIRLRRDPSSDDRPIVIELSDNGPGIPEKIHHTLFEPFVTHGKSHGTGLGMAITKSMVEANGGSISFTSKAGSGTTFTIKLPT